jgi:hypothetical protein
VQNIVTAKRRRPAFSKRRAGGADPRHSERHAAQAADFLHGLYALWINVSSKERSSYRHCFFSAFFILIQIYAGESDPIFAFHHSEMAN